MSYQRFEREEELASMENMNIRILILSVYWEKARGPQIEKLGLSMSIVQP
jgi:hypothetical protein